MRRAANGRNTMSLTCASFFAGVGGIDKGFEAVGFKTIYANEFDANAATTYRANYPDVHLDVCDIRTLDENIDIPDFDIMLAGFPCQAFSIAGYQQGFDDEKGRGNLFFELKIPIVSVLLKKPLTLFYLDSSGLELVGMKSLFFNLQELIATSS